MEYKRPTDILFSKSLLDINKDCWKQQELKVDAIKKISKGERAVLCIIDDGVGVNIELQGNEIERWSYLDPRIENVGSHSTFAATIIAGKKIGIFPKLQIISKQVLTPSIGTGRTDNIINAIYKALDLGIETINLSLGSNYYDKKLEKALYDYCKNGINIATVASGNDGPSVDTTDYPARFAKKIKGVFSVAATELTKDGAVKVSLFSSRGVVTVSAPGHGLKSMDHKDRLDFVSGTSFSAPIVGAAIAVARTLITRKLYQDEVHDLFIKSSEKTSEESEESDGGYGNVNIVEFLTEVKKLPNEYTYTMDDPISICERIKQIVKKGIGFVK